MPDESLYMNVLQNMEHTLNLLCRRVPLPQLVSYKDSLVFRHVEQTIYQAIVQKLARMISTLAATHILMTRGFVQEQGALQRILGELHEDITFLTMAAITKDVTPLHKEYLAAFFEEEFDADTAVASTQRRPMVPRKKIQAWIARHQCAGLDPSTGLELARTITKGYSGYVHAASPHIMDMYAGNPPRFHVNGMLGTERHDGHREDLWNYFYRSILAIGFAATAFGDQALFKQIAAFLVEFERRNGRQYSPGA